MAAPKILYLPTELPSPSPTAAAALSSRWNSRTGDPAMTQWCKSNCASGFCPPNKCVQDDDGSEEPLAEAVTPMITSSTPVLDKVFPKTTTAMTTMVTEGDHAQGCCGTPRENPVCWGCGKEGFGLCHGSSKTCSIECKGAWLASKGRPLCALEVTPTSVTARETTAAPAESQNVSTAHRKKKKGKRGGHKIRAERRHERRDAKKDSWEARVAAAEMEAEKTIELEEKAAIENWKKAEVNHAAKEKKEEVKTEKLAKLREESDALEEAAAVRRRQR